MPTMTGDWTGKIMGTNTGDVFLEIIESDTNITGTVRINDPMYGSAVYSANGSRDKDVLHIKLTPSNNEYSTC